MHGTNLFGQELRRRGDDVDEKRLEVSARYEALIQAHWSAATTGADPVAANTVMKVMADYTRLWGLDAATRVSLSVGISAEEFAERARELLAITGDAPLRKLAGLPVADATYEDISPADDGWSNLGDTPAAAATEWVPEPEPVPVVVERPDDDKDDDAKESEVVVAEVVQTDAAQVAEVVPIRPPRLSPPRSVPAGEVIDENGVP